MVSAKIELCRTISGPCFTPLKAIPLEEFDPYLEWLDIPPMIRPLNHYLILGLKVFENDKATIIARSDERLVRLKKFQTGPRGELSQALCDQVAQAKAVLISAEKKANYDQQLRATLDQADLRAEQSQVEPAGQATPNSSKTKQKDDFSEFSIISESNTTTPVKAPAKNSETCQVTHNVKQESPAPENLSRRILVLMALVSITVLAMTTTVLVFRGNATNDEGPAPDAVVKAPITNSKPPETSKTEISKATSGVTKKEATETKLELVNPSKAGTFSLPLSKTLASKVSQQSLPDRLTEWQDGGTAKWQLSTQQRGKGYFKFRVTYTAKYESRFSVQFDQRKPRTFTLYPHGDPFTEEIIVRVAKQDEQVLALRAVKGTNAAAVTITKIELAPND